MAQPVYYSPNSAGFYPAMPYTALPPTVEQIPKTVFVGGLPAKTTEAELAAFFSKFVRVVKCKVVPSSEKFAKSYGFITVDNEAHCRLLKGLTTEELCFNGKLLNVAPAARRIYQNEQEYPYTANGMAFPVGNGYTYMFPTYPCYPPQPMTGPYCDDFQAPFLDPNGNLIAPIPSGKMYAPGMKVPPYAVYPPFTYGVPHPEYAMPVYHPPMYEIGHPPGAGTHHAPHTPPPAPIPVSKSEERSTPKEFSYAMVAAGRRGLSATLPHPRKPLGNVAVHAAMFEPPSTPKSRGQIVDGMTTFPKLSRRSQDELHKGKGRPNTPNSHGRKNSSSEALTLVRLENRMKGPDGRFKTSDTASEHTHLIHTPPSDTKSLSADHPHTDSKAIQSLTKALTDLDVESNENQNDQEMAPLLLLSPPGSASDDPTPPLEE